MTYTLELKNVTQIAIHEDIGVFYVLADQVRILGRHDLNDSYGQSLVAFPIEAVLPSSTPNPLPQKLKKSVNYFSIGIQQGKYFIAGGKTSSVSGNLKLTYGGPRNRLFVPRLARPFKY